MKQWLIKALTMTLARLEGSRLTGYKYPGGGHVTVTVEHEGKPTEVRHYKTVDTTSFGHSDSEDTHLMTRLIPTGPEKKSPYQILGYFKDLNTAQQARLLDNMHEEHCEKLEKTEGEDNG